MERFILGEQEDDVPFHSMFIVILSISKGHGHSIFVTRDSNYKSVAKIVN